MRPIGVPTARGACLAAPRVARTLVRMAEPFAVGFQAGAPTVDAGAAVRQRADALSRANMPTSAADVLLHVGAADAIGAVLLAIALAVGPGPWLAPLGIGTDVRPSRWVALAIAAVVGARDEQWARDAAEGYEYDVPLGVQLGVVASFALGGLLVERLLLLALDNSTSFVLSLSGTFAIAAAFFEVIRPRLESRAENAARMERRDEFEVFAAELLELVPTASCHESDVVRAYRLYYPKYRAASDKISDADIELMMRRWGRAERTPAGYYKGVKLKESSLSSVF